MSLSLAPCLAANEDEEKGDKRLTWTVVALIVSATILLWAPSLIKNKRLLKEVGEGGYVRVKGLHTHFNKKQADTIAKWRATGELHITYGTSGKFSEMQLGELLPVATRYDDHDMVESVVKLATKHNVDLNFFMNDALTISIENENLDMLQRLVKIASEKDVGFLPLNTTSILEVAAKHDRIDIVEQVVKIASEKDVHLFSWDIVSMFEATVKHDRIDMAEQVVKIASEKDVSLSSQHIVSMFEATVKHDRIDMAEQVVKIASEKDVSLPRSISFLCLRLR